MDIIQLEHFLAIVDEGTFTRAAERVYRTQPALSQSIRKLEEEVGVQLLTRDVHDVSLTEAGKLLATYARGILDLCNEATRQIERLKRLESGSLSIASHESAAVYLLPGPMRAFLQEHPNIKIGIYRHRLEEIPHCVMDREVEIGFVKDQPQFHELQCIDIHSDEMVLIAPPNHPLVLLPRVSIKDLDGLAFVVHHVCSSTAEIVLRLFEQNHSHCNVVSELWSFENVKTFVREGVGLAIVPRITVLQELQDKALLEIPLDELKIPRRTIMIFRRDYLSEPARELVKALSCYKHEVLSRRTETALRRDQTPFRPLPLSNSRRASRSRA
jgi:DNA-binding transcriptional LysR family regulator